MLAIITIGILMRQTIVAIIPGFAILMLLRRRDLDRHIIVFIFISLLIFLPYLVRGAFIGHPAFDSNSPSQINNLFYSFKSGIPLISILNNLMFWAFFIPFCFYKVWRKFDYIIIILTLMLILYVTFYNIRPILWGVGRYQIELTLPFVILGIFTFMFFNMFKIINYILLLLLLLNIYIYNTFRSWNSSYDILKYKYYELIKLPFGHLIESESNFPIDEVLSKLRIRSDNKRFYYHYGVTYGVMPEIMCGYSISQVLRQNMINNDFSSIKEDSIFFKLNTDNNLKTIIFSDKEDKVIIDQFVKNGWNIKQRFKLINSGTINVIER